ncbi:MAG: carbohydrate ABC transporter permease [Candidatus Nanopelagicales bacterium]
MSVSLPYQTAEVSEIDHEVVRTSRRRFRPRHVAGRVAVNITGLVVIVVMAFPVYWLVISSFKPGKDLLTRTPQFFPTHPTLANYADALSRPYFWTSVRNSLIVTVVTVALSLVIAFLAALAVSRMNFRGRTAYVVMIIMVQMVPLTALIISLYLMLNAVHLTDQLVGVIFTYLAFVLPFTIWTLRGFVMNIPPELEEAALVDGCTRMQAFRRIVFPLVAPGLVATSVFAFIQAWNEYVLAYVLLSSQSKQTLTVWLAAFTTQKGTEWGPLMAASVLTAMPVVIFFLLVQNRMASGLTAGAVKG